MTISHHLAGSGRIDLGHLEEDGRPIFKSGISRLEASPWRAQLASAAATNGAGKNRGLIEAVTFGLSPVASKTYLTGHFGLTDGLCSLAGVVDLSSNANRVQRSMAGESGKYGV
ncbi:MAG: hypothetical protein ABJF67_08290 [Aurantimonas coralicida]|uniref:hypothetical protein n=1 Tax=Nisaea sp. TaxID=2024842 RepID=UPI003265E1CD